MRKNKKEKIFIFLLIIFLLIIIIFTFYLFGKSKNFKKSIEGTRIHNLLSYINMSVLDLDISKNNLKSKSKLNANIEKNIEFDIFFDDDKVSKSVKLFNVSNGNKDKIFPGSYGKFAIIIANKNLKCDMEYEIKFEDLTNEKPTNMVFYTSENNEKYSTLQELEENINGKIVKNSNKKIIINWKWLYENNDDEIDTLEGINFRNYKFKIIVIGKEKEN